MKSAAGRDNRTIVQKSEFNAVFINATNIDTVIKMLYSNEMNIVKDAIIALNRYAMKAPENVKELYDTNILDAILYLLFYSLEIDIQRFNLKLLALLIQLPEVINESINNIEIPLRVATYLLKIKDEFMHEYASIILAALTNDTPIGWLLLKLNLLPVIWAHFDCNADLDVLNASLKIVYNLLQIPYVIDQLFDIPNFKLEPLIYLFDSQYVDIQKNSLTLMKCIVTKADDKDIYDLIVTSAIPVFDKLLLVLTNDHFITTFTTVLNILLELFHWPPTVEQFLIEECLPKLIKFIENCLNEEFLSICLDILTNLAKVDNARHELYILCIDKFLINLLQNSTNLALKVCCTINEMVRHPKAVKTFIDNKSIESILAQLFTRSSGEPTTDWQHERGCVIDMLAYLLWCDPQVPDFIVQTPTLFNIFLDTLNYNYTIIPAPYFSKFLYLFQAFVVCKKWYNCILKTNILDSLCKLLEQNMDVVSRSVKIVILDVLTAYMCDQIAVDWCTQNNYYLYPLQYLDSSHTKLVYSAVAFINQLCNYKKVAQLFIKRGLIELLQKREKEFDHFPMWKQTLKHLYDLHLPKKFHNLCYLDVTDITEERFYVSKYTQNPLPVLEDLLASNVTPTTIIYVATFEYRKPPVKQLEMIFAEFDEVNEMIQQFIDSFTENRVKRQYKKCQFPNATHSSCSLNQVDADSTPSIPPPAPPPSVKEKKSTKMEKSYKLYRALDENVQTRYRDAGNERQLVRAVESIDLPTDDVFNTIAPRLMSWLGCLPPDPYLRSYLKAINQVFHRHSNEKSIFNKLISRIEFLAQFVHTATAGPINSSTYLKKSAQLEHLNILKYKYSTNLIPLGFIRIGSALERAVLFKILADRLNIPCRLIRNSKCVWNEVPLVCCTSPTTDDNNLLEQFDGPIIYYLVDLMKFPGRLYPVQTQLAIEYCNSNWFE